MNWKELDSNERERQCLLILSKAAARRFMGERKYGNNSFFGTNLFDSIEEELLDIINYAIFEIIKLRQLDEIIKEKAKEFEIELEEIKQVELESICQVTPNYLSELEGKLRCK